MGLASCSRPSGLFMSPLGPHGFGVTPEPPEGQALGNLALGRGALMGKWGCVEGIGVGFWGALLHFLDLVFRGSRPRRSQVPELGQNLRLLPGALLPAHLSGGGPGGKGQAPGESRQGKTTALQGATMGYHHFGVVPRRGLGSGG